MPKEKLNFEKLDGLLPVVIQDCQNGEVLMVGFMNEEAWRLTLKTKKVHYYSRKKKRIWMKGEESGHVQHVRKVEVDTPYGKPSGEVTIGQLAGKRVVFLPRHGPNHTIPPHKVQYKANLWAIRSLGVSHVLATCVVGSLKEEIRPGDFVTPDQFINFTWGRDDTHDVDREVVHLPMAEPYCDHLKNELCEALSALPVTRHERGTIVVIQGPRFSTIAESKMYALLGGDIVNMTQYPECYFARDLGLCYSAVASVTDYDVGVESSISMRPGSMDQVLKIFHRNTALTQELLARFMANVTALTVCECAKERLDEYYEARK